MDLDRQAEPKLNTGKWLYRCMVLSFVSFILLGWIISFFAGFAPVPFGLCPMLVMAGSLISDGVFILCALLVFTIYFFSFVFLRGVKKHRKYGTAGLLLFMATDCSANIIFSAVSWWYILGAFLDLLLLFISYQLYRYTANTNE